MGKRTQSNRNLGIDLLKAILAIMILCRHAALVSILLNQGASWMQAAPMAKFVYFFIQGMCVPLFMVVSLFFYVQKRATNKSYFKKRLVRLIQIICFWWPVYFILTQTTEFPLVPDNALGAVLIPFLNGSMYFLGGIVFSVLCIELIEKIIEILPEKYTN